MQSSSQQFSHSMIHFYYGNGCGKTSIAIGHIIRALGHQYSPILIQFLKKHDPSGKKGYNMGEIRILNKLQVPIIQFGGYGFVKTQKQIEDNRNLAKKALLQLEDILQEEKYDLVVLDEIGSMIKLDLIKPVEIIKILKEKKPHIEVIMTGHDRISEFETLCDYITELKEIAHPFKRSIQARKGIEY